MADPTPEDVYRAAAEANDLVRPGRITVYTDVLATDPSFRAGVDAAYAAGREAAAQAIEATLAAREAQGCTYIRIADVRQALGGGR